MTQTHSRLVNLEVLLAQMGKWFPKFPYSVAEVEDGTWGTIFPITDQNPIQNWPTATGNGGLLIESHHRASIGSNTGRVLMAWSKPNWPKWSSFLQTCLFQMIYVVEIHTSLGWSVGNVWCKGCRRERQISSRHSPKTACFRWYMFMKYIQVVLGWGECIQDLETSH